MPFCRTSFQINLFLPLEAHCCRLRIFCFTDSWKNITKFCVLVPWPWRNYISQKRKRPLFSKNALNIFRIHVYKFSFLHCNTSNICRVNSNYWFRPRWKPLRARVGDCCLKSSKKSRLFYSHNFRKNYKSDCSFIASFLWFFHNVWVVSGRRQLRRWRWK